MAGAACVPRCPRGRAPLPGAGSSQHRCCHDSCRCPRASHSALACQHPMVCLRQWGWRAGPGWERSRLLQRVVPAAVAEGTQPTVQPGAARLTCLTLVCAGTHLRCLGRGTYTAPSGLCAAPTRCPTLRGAGRPGWVTPEVQPAATAQSPCECMSSSAERNRQIIHFLSFPIVFPSLELLSLVHWNSQVTHRELPRLPRPSCSCSGNHGAVHPCGLPCQRQCQGWRWIGAIAGRSCPLPAGHCCRTDSSCPCPPKIYNLYNLRFRIFKALCLSLTCSTCIVSVGFLIC